ncbi:hypothetical protein F5Y16DRAFT_397862 [Xylariaceae sp. FL0255]|nr:hypothetical protein F5Y16DRAFT_397862 [Xylariaceae sp. FL0255]
MPFHYFDGAGDPDAEVRDDISMSSMIEVSSGSDDSSEFTPVTPPDGTPTSPYATVSPLPYRSETLEVVNDLMINTPLPIAVLTTADSFPDLMADSPPPVAINDLESLPDLIDEPPPLIWASDPAQRNNVEGVGVAEVEPRPDTRLANYTLSEFVRLPQGHNIHTATRVRVTPTIGEPEILISELRDLRDCMGSMHGRVGYEYRGVIRDLPGYTHEPEHWARFDDYSDKYVSFEMHVRFVGPVNEKITIHAQTIREFLDQILARFPSTHPLMCPVIFGTCSRVESPDDELLELIIKPRRKSHRELALEMAERDRQRRIVREGPRGLRTRITPQELARREEWIRNM